MIKKKNSVIISIFAVIFFAGASNSLIVTVRDHFGGHDDGTVLGAFDSIDEPLFFVAESLPIESYQPLRTHDSYDLTVENAHASIVLDVDSGTILHAENANEHRQIASLTKIVTAMLVIDHVKDREELLTVSERATRVVGSKVGCPSSGYCKSNRIVAGEKLKVNDTLKAMLMSSSNDAATALAEHVGGDMEGFVAMMNDRMRELDLTDTNFCTPSGLETDGAEKSCYSTAHDIASVMAHMLAHSQYDVLWEIMRTEEDIFYGVDTQLEHKIGNTDKLIGELDGLVGAKTGFTPNAGFSLILAAQDAERKHRVIAVVLDNPYRWNDIQDMVAWAFDSHEWH